MAIGDYIKYKTGLSQRALAAELGMNHNAIQRRFSGAGVMDVETLVKIADRYSLDLLDLMVESGLITASRANSLRVGGSIRDVSNEDLMGEVLRRMSAPHTPAATTPQPTAASTPPKPAQPAAAGGASKQAEHEYTADDYALAAKRGEPYDSEEGFFGA
ncbi:MAG: helix-turn-helix transcriptional regulator [Rothia sp. (in: high G+C Gram-positive bacteria)]|uniref:helix-turn-helix domain-containing protein n=1 Tax=Rothia sp. (in: high G+C Gram-positive bacteria) TaxID=1885016 RepID=UPI0026DAEA08|nr:helix-turn-helix transcriptional regulator [Rothia sp. (in: high G+C Gram-positive bacteria)]MDO4883370.1 helix-turn-helix transcriptional regulator [Rothia sp. (in: high G+C Gram-positive bacteria)]